MTFTVATDNVRQRALVAIATIHPRLKMVNFEAHRSGRSARLLTATIHNVLIPFPTFGPRRKGVRTHKTGSRERSDW
jgi:hypothetical protein